MIIYGMYTRVIISCELESYQQALACAFREMRPDVRVLEARPWDLDRLVLRVSPAFVVCSHSTTMVREHAPGWVRLYIDFGPTSMVCIDGKLSMIDDLELPQLASILEQAERGLA